MSEPWDVIDMFCGAGGTSDGIVGSGCADVTHAINHSEAAIHAHHLRHPETIHIQSDVRDPKTVMELPRFTNVLWASLECTNYSIAKGGMSRSADSRTLANELPKHYVPRCNPNYVIIENVKEFKDWGPLIPKRDKLGNKMKILRGKDKGKYIMVPDPKKKGQDFLKWKYQMMSLGYGYSERMLNSANFGAGTRRIRLFIIFAKKGFPIAWPKETHTEEQWVPCKNFIDLENEGTSIFGRSFNMNLPKNLRRPLVHNTLNRIGYGMRKYVSDGEFIIKYYGSDGQVSGINEPLHTITTKARHAHVKMEMSQFITQNIHKSPWSNASIEKPLGTILTRDEKALVTVKRQYITRFFGRDNAVASIENPLPTISTLNQNSLITVEKSQFIDKYFGGKYNVSSIEKPLGTITTGKQPALVTAQHGGIYLHDVKMRFLYPSELAGCTGFKNWETLGRSNKEQIKHIGNAVVPVMSEVIIETLFNINIQYGRKTA